MTTDGEITRRDAVLSTIALHTSPLESAIVAENTGRMLGCLEELAMMSIKGDRSPEAARFGLLIRAAIRTIKDNEYSAHERGEDAAETRRNRAIKGY